MCKAHENLASSRTHTKKANLVQRRARPHRPYTFVQAGHRLADDQTQHAAVWAQVDRVHRALGIALPDVLDNPLGDKQGAGPTFCHESHAWLREVRRSGASRACPQKRVWFTMDRFLQTHAFSRPGVLSFLESPCDLQPSHSGRYIACKR